MSESALSADSLRAIYEPLIRLHFNETKRLRDPQLQDYVVSLVCDFSSCDELFKIRDQNGRPIHDINEMLLESDPVYGRAQSFDRERQVRKHIGDYTLFLTGLFPEAFNKEGIRRAKIGTMGGFVQAGKESYYIVSSFRCFEYANVASLFAMLADHFEFCVAALHLVNHDLSHPRPVLGPEFDAIINIQPQ